MFLKLRLRAAGIEYDGVNIGEDPDAAALVRSVNNGDELTPTVAIGDVYLSNPRLRDVRAAVVAARNR